MRRRKGPGTIRGRAGRLPVTTVFVHRGLSRVRRPANPKALRDLSIDAERKGGRHRLLLRGELDLTSAPKLTDAVARACTDGATEVILDVSRLEFIDSTGLRAILNSRALCEEAPCEFSLTPGHDQVRHQVRRLLEITGLLNRLPFREPGPADGQAPG
jgi:anti-sigma B factor antagonist